MHFQGQGKYSRAPVCPYNSCTLSLVLMLSRRGWTKYSSPPPDHIIRLRIALKQSNYAELERHLMEISDPDHDRYGQHLTKEEVDALIAPHDDTSTLVNEWIANHGLSEEHLERSAAKDWITLSVPVNVAEKMLDTVSLK